MRQAPFRPVPPGRDLRQDGARAAGHPRAAASRRQPCSCPPPRSNRRSARGSRRRRRARDECFRSRATLCTATLATSRPSFLCSCSDSRCGSLICSSKRLRGTLPTTPTACAPVLAGGPHQLGAVQHAHGLSGLAWRGDARSAAYRARGRSAVEWTAAWLLAHAHRVRAQWPPLGRQCLADALRCGC